MINYTIFALIFIIMCICSIAIKDKYGNYIIQNQLPFILMILVTILIGVFFSTADEVTLSSIPTVKVSHDNIKDINPSCEAKISMSGMYNNPNTFYLTDATTLDDLDNFISVNNGSCEFIIYNTEGTIIFSHIFDNSSSEQIYQVYKQWKATGKFDLNTVRVEFFKIFYVNQL